MVFLLEAMKMELKLAGVFCDDHAIVVKNALTVNDAKTNPRSANARSGVSILSGGPKGIPHLP
jgi:hypothetical protein